jgi:uncharacterized protein
MSTATTTAVLIPVSGSSQVSGLLQRPRAPRVCLLLAHGAGAGMTHPFMTALADELAGRDIATLRYQFPYMEKRSKRPDPPALCHATVRAAASIARELLPQTHLIAGGKSFGGRMSSQAQAKSLLPEVRGLVFFGFPLHPAGRPSNERAEHLFQITVPMLFLQGTRDALAEPALLQPIAERLGERATLEWFEDADHSFHVPARSGLTDADVRVRIGDVLATWWASCETASTPPLKTRARSPPPRAKRR